MSNPTFAGVIPPVVTPLTAHGELDEESFIRVLERLVEHGVHGIFVLGSTGEVAFSTDAQRGRIIELAVQQVAGRIPVLAGVIDTQTARVKEHIDQAVALGVDGVVATAPFYAITPPAQVRRHFELLGEHSQVPVFAYDIPVCVHTKLDWRMLVELGSQGSIAGVKDSSLDDVSLRWLVDANRRAGRPLTILTGHEVAVDGAYLAGVDGCVPGLANVDPAGYVALHDAAMAGDWERARTLQDSLARLMQIALVPTTTAGWGAGVGSFLTALHRMGILESNQAPEPFPALSQEDSDRIGVLLDEHEWVGRAAR